MMSIKLLSLMVLAPSYGYTVNRLCKFRDKKRALEAALVVLQQKRLLKKGHVLLHPSVHRTAATALLS